MSDRDAFLAGERLDDVAIYLPERTVDDPGPLEAHGDRVDDGIVLVVPGDVGRTAMQGAVGVDPFTFAQSASGTDGDVARDLTGGTCPEGDGEAHRAQFVFAFAEGQKDDVEGLYTEGDVIHGYAMCACGTSYAEKWLTATD